MDLNDCLFSTKFRQLAPKKDLVEQYLFGLQKRYTEPHRTYHNGQHIEDGLKRYFDLFDTMEPHAFYAWAYHDAVYDPLAKDNEERSAHLLYDEVTKLGLTALQREWAVDMVLATKLNSAHSTVVNDMDLSVFGGDIPVYLKYVKEIRAEYAAIPDKTFNAGRLHVLQILQQRKPFFHTSEFYAAYEIQAGLNMASEIRALSEAVKQ